MTREEIEAVLAIDGAGSKVIIWKGLYEWIATVKRQERKLWITQLLATGNSEEEALNALGRALENSTFPLQPLYESQR